MQYQLCKSCNKTKELTSSNYGSGTNNRNGVSVPYWYKKCKDCDRDRVNKKTGTYKRKNRKKLITYQQEYYSANKEKYQEYYKEFYQNNKDKIKQTSKINLYKRRKDSSFRLKENISSSIRVCINKNRQSFFKHMPYSLNDLKNHLESNFESWMTWDNYGVYRVDSWDDNDQSTWTWQIDHIIPHSCFNYSSMDEAQFLECWALKNLRPYSAKQNIIDGKRDI